MGKATLIDEIRWWIGGLCFRMYLWLYKFENEDHYIDSLMGNENERMHKEQIGNTGNYYCHKCGTKAEIVLNGDGGGNNVIAYYIPPKSSNGSDVVIPIRHYQK